MTFTTHSSGNGHFNATYGAAAMAIQDHLKIMYERRSGSPVQDWETATHENGLVILLPKNSEVAAQAALDVIDPSTVFSRAAVMAYEALCENNDLEDDGLEALASTLLSAAGEAEELASGI